MEYFRLYADINYPERWYLGDINMDNPWIFTEGRSIDEKALEKLHVEIHQKGIAVDYTETSTVGVPVISEDFAELLYGYTDEIQLIRVSVPNAIKNYYIMVVRNNIDCVDETKSDFEKFEEGNDIRPDLAGEYEVINVLVIDTNKVNKTIFRLSKYDIFIIINADLKSKLENAGLTGFKFKLVS